MTAQLQQTLRQLPPEKRQSLTLDNGREFARPIELEKKLAMPIYFAHPYHSWERGTNENTNGLLRQYLPKGTDLTPVTSEQLHAYVRQINHRPRKCLDFQTPLRGLSRQTIGIALAGRSHSPIDSPAGRRIGLWWEPTRAPLRPRGRGDVVGMHVALPSILSLAQCEKSQGSGDSVPRTPSEENDRSARKCHAVLHFAC